MHNPKEASRLEEIINSAIAITDRPIFCSTGNYFIVTETKSSLEKEIL